MAPLRVLSALCLWSGVTATSDAALTIDGTSTMMRRSVPPPYAALDDMDYSNADSTDHRVGVSSAEAAAANSGLLATLQKVRGEGEPEEVPLGTLVLLLDSEDQAAMQDVEENLVPSILANLKFRTPVTVLFSGPRGPAEDATFKLQLNPSIMDLSLVDVSLRVDQFAQQDARKHMKKQGRSLIQEGKTWKMNEFWAMHVHLLPELQKFHYAWLLTPKSKLTDGITTDLFKVMRQQKAALGYRLLRNERQEACAGLQNAAHEFYQVNDEYSPRDVNARAFLETYEEAECPLWTPDFQILDLDYLRENEGYADYIKYIADIGGFAKYGWGVPNVQAVFLATQEAPQRMLCMTPWVPGYEGDSNLGCNEGTNLITFLQGNLKDKFSNAGALEVKETNATQILSDAYGLANSSIEVPKAALKAYMHLGPVAHTGLLARLASWRIISVAFGLLCIWVAFFIKKRMASVTGDGL